MTVNKISPISVQRFGIKSLLSNQYMLSFFKKFCNEISSRMWATKKARNARYEKEDYLRVFFFSEIIGRSIHETSERLNEYYLSKRKGRRKIFIDGRKKREVPRQTDINKFLRKISLKRAKDILRECLDYQLKEALKLKIISKKVNVLTDFTEHAYYGKRDDKMINGTNRQKGTKKMRNYLGFSILSKGTLLFAGLEHVARGQSRIPIVINHLEHLLNIGFQLSYVIMDREFYRAEILDEVKGMKGNVLIPAKSYKKIKQFIEEYLKNMGKRVRRYKFSSAPGARCQFFQNAYLILGAKKGYSLTRVKQDFQRGKLFLKDAMKLIYAIMTTQKPRGKTSSWASRTSRFYKKRWFIETAFSDINRMGCRWKSRYDDVRYLDVMVRLFLYNSWKINRALLKTYQKKQWKSRAWSLFQNQDYLEKAFLQSEKKLEEVMC